MSPRRWLFAMAALVGALAWSRVQLSNEQAAHATTKQQHAQAVANAERRIREAEAKNRATEQELTRAHSLLAETTQAQLDAARRAAVAVRESRGLRNAAAAAAKRVRAICTTASAADTGQADGDPIGVLAHVLASADARAGALAAIADEARIRGLACEGAYETARRSLTR